MRVARHMLTKNNDVPHNLQDFVAIWTAFGNVHNGKLADFTRFFKNTFATDAEADTITQVIPVNVGCPDDYSVMDSAVEHEVRLHFAFFFATGYCG